jgi:hypothetical protein
LAGGGAAAAGVIIETIDGLSSWLEENDDNCAVATAAAAWGRDCSLSKEECTDTGLWSATCNTDVENGCAHGIGNALAEESIFGMWWGFTTNPEVSAISKPLHIPTPNDQPVTATVGSGSATERPRRSPSRSRRGPRKPNTR